MSRRKTSLAVRNERVPLPQFAAFLAPKLTLGIMTAPVFYVLPAFYAQHTRATLAELGTALVVSRLFDAVTDPLIGWFSDRTHTPLGARKPWILAASVMVAVAVFFLFNPSAGVGVLYFTGWSLLFYLGWTMWELPFDAWLTELTRSYTERSRIAGWQGLASQAGGFIFFCSSTLGVFGKGMSRALMSAFGWVALVILPLSVIWTAVAVPTAPPSAKGYEAPRLSGLFRALKLNPSLQLLLASQLFGGLGGGIYLGSQLLLLDGYFHQADNFGLLFMAYQVVHFAAMPVWLRVVYRFGKHRTWAVSWILGALMTPLMLLVAPGPGALPWLIVLALLRSGASGADIVVPRALMADAVDYGILKTGENAAGVYFAAWSLAVKFAAAVSSGLAFWLLAAVGYNPKPGAANTHEAVIGLIVTGLLLPMACNVVAASFIWFFPIDERRAGIIRRRIEGRPQLAAAT